MDLKSSWIDEYSTGDSLEILGALALKVANRAGNFATELKNLVINKDYLALLSYSSTIDYKSASVGDVIAARQVCGFFEKFEPLGDVLGIDREAEGFVKFMDAEKDCAATNAFFKSYNEGRVCLLPAFDSILHAAKWKIEKVLGKCPNWSDLRPSFGPGATTNIKRKDSVPAEKLGKGLYVGMNLVPYIPFIVAAEPHWWNFHSESSYDATTEEEIQNGCFYAVPGRLQFVPKDAKSYRSVIIEPVISSYYQSAIGDIIANKLRSNGVDITNQTLNQELARYGSVSGALATLDLSSASDTISRELVKFLFPEDWYSLLNAVRTVEVEYNGTYIQQEKFSSMGNGTTFPLETLIFFALTWAASPHHERSFINAYGDDIICGSDSSLAVKTVLTQAGFHINEKKSFVSGPFRESCGADYLSGFNVRPVRAKKLLSGEKLYTLYNFFARNYDDEMCQSILKYLPDPIFGPDGYGDGHLVDHLWYTKRLRSEKSRKLGWGGFVFDSFSRCSFKNLKRKPGDYLHLLYAYYVRSDELDIGGSLFSSKVKGFVTEHPSITKAGKLEKVSTAEVQSYKRTSIYTLTS